MSDWYWIYRERGCCTRCGLKLPDGYFYVNCESCRVKHNRHVRDVIRAKRAGMKISGGGTRPADYVAG